jgi:hypothetical protein
MISVLLVMYRILSRRAWNRDTECQLTTLRWAVISGGPEKGDSAKKEIEISHAPSRSLVQGAISALPTDGLVA